MGGAAAAPMRFHGVVLMAFTLSCAPLSLEGEDEREEVRQGILLACTAFVAPNGVDLPNAGTQARPWRTIQYAVSGGRIRAGAKLCIVGRTSRGPEVVYRENPVVLVSGLASDPIEITGLGVGNDRPLIDGTNDTDHPRPADCPAALAVYGQSNLVISNLRITHRGNSSRRCEDGGTECLSGCSAIGLSIVSAAPSGQPPVPSNGIVVDHVEVSGLRTPRSDQVAIPFQARSDDEAGVRRLVLSNSHFADNDTVAEASGSGLSTVNIGSNVRDFLVTRNTFDDFDTGGVELGGNLFGPSQPVGGVISENTFIGSGRCYPSVADCQLSASGVYNQAARNILIERNFFDHVGIGVNVKTELVHRCSHAPVLAAHTWVRNNVFSANRGAELQTGANDQRDAGCNYSSVDGVYFTQNTIYRRNGDVNSVGSVFIDSNPVATLIGDSAVLNNLIMTEERLYFIQGTPQFRSAANYLVSTRPVPFYDDGDVTWAQWLQTHDQGSPTGAAFVPVFVSSAPTLRSDFRLSNVSSPAHNRGLATDRFGTPTTPSWAAEGFGAYTPPTELDFYGGPRETPTLTRASTRDLGADEY